ncbi:MAG: hypothetical protein E7641_07670 [Ruminococcaceae bacterium]|nr:hypothetical protein [Oscillospiraceae bacterium]
MDSIKEAVNSGAITAPHIATHPHMELCEHGVFAWYAKTADGVLGIVRVNWSYIDRGCKSLYNNYYDDDAYFLVDQNGLYEPITRDDLLLKLEGYECDYIYTGRYDSFGKERNIAVCF